MKTRILSRTDDVLVEHGEREEEGDHAMLGAILPVGSSHVNMTNNGSRRQLVVRLALAVLSTACAGHSQTFTAFDPPGSIWTNPMGINSHGRIVGLYQAGSSEPGHGFIRLPDGSFTAFDAPCPSCPGSYGTQAIDIDSEGNVVGSVLPTAAGATIQGFVRSADGEFTLFVVPNSSATFPWSINSAGQILGYYTDSAGVNHGFLRQPDGSLTTLDVPGAALTLAYLINAEGRTGGYYRNLAGVYHGFIWQTGTFITFDRPNSIETAPEGLDSKGRVGGTYYDPAHNRHGFLRRRDGTLVTIDVPNASYTYATAMSPKGAIAGEYSSATSPHVFLWQPDGTFTSFDPPDGTVAIVPHDMNSSGVVRRRQQRPSWFSD